MDATKKPQLIELMDASGGANSVEYPTQIGEKQVAPESIGCMLKKSGIVKYPGVVGIFKIVDDSRKLLYKGSTYELLYKAETNELLYYV